MKLKYERVVIISLLVIIGWTSLLLFLALYGPSPRRYAYVTPDMGQVELRDKLEDLAKEDTSLLYQPDFIRENYQYRYTSLSYYGNYILSSFLYLKDVNCFLNIEGRRGYGKDKVIIKQVSDLDQFPDVDDYCEGYHFYHLSEKDNGPKPSKERMEAIQRSFEQNVLSKVGLYHRDIQGLIVGSISEFVDKNFRTIIFLDVFFVVLLISILFVRKMKQK
jgi:hypothetical protein